MIDLNSFRNWRITFLLTGYIFFKNEVSINGIKFKQRENDPLATVVIESKNIEEAQNVAKERIDELLVVMSAILKQKITAEMKEIKPIIADGFYGQAISFLNGTAISRMQFPNHKVSEIEELFQLSLNDNNIKKVIALLSKPHPRTWENLYKIYEVINDNADIVKKIGRQKLKLRILNILQIIQIYWE